MATSNEAFQQQVIEARKKQILDAAGRVFGRKGYHHATIRDVALEAGIAIGTIYNYFRNKEDLMRGLLARLQQAEGRTAAYGAGVGNDFNRFLPAYFRRQMAFMMANRELFQALLPELLVDAELQEIYRQQVLLPNLDVTALFMEGQQPGGAIQPVDPALVSRTIAAVILGNLVLELMGERTVHERWGELPDVMSALFLKGLSS
jgi:AcrR family transcriptional regulator